MKNIFLNLHEQHGYQEYHHLSVHQILNTEDIDEWANNYAANFYPAGSSEKNEDNDYEIFGGEMVLSVYEVKIITEDEYKILRKFL